MMKFSLNVSSRTDSEITVEDGALRNLPKFVATRGPTQLLLITDTNVAPLYGDDVESSFRAEGWSLTQHVIPAGEHFKTLRSANEAYGILAGVKMPRDGLIVALGGGVVGDLAGFVAGTWMRGIKWVNCPTTMEADVDACLGGKTAVNLPNGKNLVGVFHHPTAVIADPNCLKTLPRRDICAGLAEAIKHALLQSPDELAWLEANAEKILSLDSVTTCTLIERNLRFKAQIVSEDPRENSAQRILLNFGHTMGHAIETCAKGELRHGECVGLGMLAAMQISQRLGLHDNEVVDRARRLLERFELPTQLARQLSRHEVLECILLDKKAAAGKVRMILLADIGVPVIRDDLAPAWIAEAFDSLVTD